MKNERPKTFDITQHQCAGFIDRFSTKRAFLKAFRKEYSNILVYHASNLSQLEIDDVMINGLRRSSPALLKELALRRFVAAGDSTEMKKDVEATIDDYCSRLDYPNEKEVNFSIAREELESEHYHYLLFGPETLHPLAHELTNRHGFSFKRRMIEHGFHCIVIASLNTSLVESVWIENLFDERSETPLVYYEDIPPQQIVKIDKVSRPIDKWNIGYF